MKKYNILVIEDDTDIQQLVSYNLIKSGCNVTCADSGEEGLQFLEKESFSAIILDLMLPGRNGMEICHQIRMDNKIKHIPVVMLTAKSEEDDIIAGLDCGADDYVTKPFSPRILVAKLEAIIRREDDKLQASGNDEEIITVHDLQIMPARHDVTVNGQTVRLTGSEFSILLFMARKPGWVFSRQQIIDKMRGYDYSITPRAVDVQIFGLRKKLGSSGDCIETIRGIGYRMKVE